MQMMAFACKLCSFRAFTWKLWLRHTFEAHSAEPTFRLRCGCCSTFKCYSSMLSHLSRKHSGQCEISSSNPSCIEGVPQGIEDEILSNSSQDREDHTLNENCFAEETDEYYGNEMSTAEETQDEYYDNVTDEMSTTEQVREENSTDDFYGLQVSEEDVQGISDVQSISGASA